MRQRLLDVEHVLRELAAGKAQKAIAIEANVSESTVSQSLSRWARASGAKTVIQAIITWARAKEER